MFNSFQQGPADFSREAKNFARVFSPPELPVVTGLLIGLANIDELTFLQL